MIILEPFIFHQNHYAYHIAHNNNMDEIINKGLLPNCGLRSRLAGDSRKAVYFFDSLYSVNDWIDRLYNNKDVENLELLRFNLKGLKWYIQNQLISDFYLLNPIEKQKLSYLRIINQNGELCNLSHIDKTLYDKECQSKLFWHEVKNYKI